MNWQPLSEAQAGLWYAQQLDPDNPAFNTAHALWMDGALNLDAFKAALAQASQESPALALTMRMGENGPEQRVDPSNTPVLDIIDLSAEPDPDARAREAMQRERLTALDPATTPLALNRLYRLGATRHLWYLRVHHLATDGYGMALFADRVCTLYNAALDGTDPGLALADLAPVLDEDAAYKSSERRDRDRQWWHQTLAGMPVASGLGPGFAAASHDGLRRVFDVPPDLRERLLEAAERIGQPWPDVLTALTASYCQRISGQEEAVIGVPFMGRLGSASARVPAMVMNVLPLRVPAHADTGITDYVQMMSRTLVRSRRHGRYRGEQLRRDLGLVGGQRRLHGPLVNVQPFYRPPQMAGLSVTLDVLATGPVDDANLGFRGNLSQMLDLEIEANPAVYDNTSVNAHAERLLAFISAALDAEARGGTLSEIPLATPQEAEQCLYAFNATSHPIPETTLSALIEARMAARPNAPALEYQGQVLSYAELEARTRALALQLRDMGVSRESMVVIALPRALELEIALIAVLRAGGAYLPIDLSHPDERIARILDSAKPACVLALEADATRFTALPVLSPSQWTTHDARPLDHRVNPADAAYVIYTSGSTGEPKGVLIEHRAIVNRLEWMRVHYGFAAGDRILQKTPMTFDVSVWEFFLPLLSGATLVMAPPDAHRDPLALVDLIHTRSITTLHFVPSMLAAFLSVPASHGLHIHRVFCSGEELSADLRDRFHQAITGELHNLYGPTEAAVDVSYWPSVDEDQLHAQIAREFKTTERLYGGQAAYVQAKTRLTYQQWITARTPTFKAWFGDWQALRAQTALDAMEPVVLPLDSRVRDLSLPELRHAVQTHLDGLVDSKMTARHPELGVIGFSKTNNRKVVSTSAVALKLHTALDIVRVIETAHHIESQPSRHEGQARWDMQYHTLAAKVTVFGQALLAVVTIKQSPDGKRFYNNIAVQDTSLNIGAKKYPGSVSPSEQPPTDAGSTSAFTGAQTSLLPFFQRVNPASLAHKLDPDTGEPRPAHLTRQPSAPVPIGFPVWNTRLYILDAQMRPLPIGVAGDLYLGGVQLARGYLGRDDLTQERFLPDPFIAGARIYKTGDLARWRSDGAVVFLGRSDHQVKLRGLRIELGEIEAALRASAQVARGEVIVREDRPGERRLVAYVQPAGTLDSHALRTELGTKLPDYMVPSAILALDDWPVTGNGKLDRRRLPAPPLETGDGAPLTSASERHMATLFAQVLQLSPSPIDGRGVGERVSAAEPIPTIHADTDFFAVGGDSLTAVQLLLAIQQHWQRDPGLGAIFSSPTVAGLAALMDAHTHKTDDGLAPAIRLLEGDHTLAPLFVIHPAGGIAWNYRDLARALNPRRSVYGLQSPVLDPTNPIPATIDALAQDYAARICELAPNGPIHLAGWSVGGIIAQAIAVELHAQKRQVGVVALLDAYPCEVWRNEPEPDPITALRALLAIAGFDPDTHQHLNTRSKIIDFLKRSDSALGNLPEAVLDGVIRAVTGTNRLIRAHHHTPYPGSLLHIRAGHDHSEKPQLHASLWHPYAKTVEALTIPFLHAHMTSREASMQIAPLLDARMTG